MKTFRFVIGRDPETGFLVGYVPGWPGAHSHGADIDELQSNLREDRDVSHRQAIGLVCARTIQRRCAAASPLATAERLGLTPLRVEAGRRLQDSLWSWSAGGMLRPSVNPSRQAPSQRRAR